MFETARCYCLERRGKAVEYLREFVPGLCGRRRRARSSTDRAPDFEFGGCTFEPCRAHQARPICCSLTAVRGIPRKLTPEHKRLPFRQSIGLPDGALAANSMAPGSQDDEDPLCPFTRTPGGDSFQARGCSPGRNPSGRGKGATGKSTKTARTSQDPLAKAHRRACWTSVGQTPIEAARLEGADSAPRSGLVVRGSRRLRADAGIRRQICSFLLLYVGQARPVEAWLE